MGLDFSALDALASNGNAAEDFNETPEVEGVPQLDRIVSGIEQERQQIAAAYKEYQENVRIAGLNITAIRKGINTGEDIYSLFLKAVDAIGKMTGNRSLYDQTRASLISVYGVGLHEPQPLQMERDGIMERLAKLEAARETAGPESRERIDCAIREHQQRAKAIDVGNAT